MIVEDGRSVCIYRSLSLLAGAYLVRPIDLHSRTYSILNLTLEAQQDFPSYVGHTDETVVLRHKCCGVVRLGNQAWFGPELDVANGVFLCPFLKSES